MWTSLTLYLVAALVLSVALGFTRVTVHVGVRKLSKLSTEPEQLGGPGSESFPQDLLLQSSSLEETRPRGREKDDIVEVRILISGPGVHGPYYRTIVKNEAVMLRKLKGQLVELKDGLTTEVVVQGHKGRVASFIKWAERGPPLALRDPVKVESVEYRPKLSVLKGFEIFLQ